MLVLNHQPAHLCDLREWTLDEVPGEGVMEECKDIHRAGGRRAMSGGVLRHKVDADRVMTLLGTAGIAWAYIISPFQIGGGEELQNTRWDVK